MTRDISYIEMLLTERWRQKREQILDRDNHQCRNCGNGNNLQIHHRQYHLDPKTGMKREPWDYDNQYLITLCDTCHEAGHQQYQIPFFKH
jgi:5-methylcytosine-specific restriction endonuclease McrA